MAIYIITGLLVILYVSFLAWLVKLQQRKHNSKVFVYPKNQHKYYALGLVKAKHPDTGEWFSAVAYISEESADGNVAYIRKEDDFLAKFVPLKEWKDDKELQSK